VFVLRGFGMPVRIGIRDKAASYRATAHWLFGDGFVFLAHRLLPCVGNSAHSVAELETVLPALVLSTKAERGLPAPVGDRELPKLYG